MADGEKPKVDESKDKTIEAKETSPIKEKSPSKAAGKSAAKDDDYDDDFEWLGINFINFNFK